jgi:nonribosomal peptide synthetase protein BlmIV
VSVADDTELFELLIGDRDMGFDLHVAPLARVTFAKVNSTAALSVAVDNTVADGWSMRILLDELSAAYTQFAHNDTAPDLGPVLQYGTWLARRDSAASSRAPAVLRFWDDVLPDDPADISVNLPGAREVPSQSPHSTVVTSTRFHSSGFCLRNLASCYGTTPFVVALTSVAIVLRFESGRDVVTIATNHANRDLDTVNNVVGWLSDIILLRFDVVRPESFEHCVSMVQGVLRTSLTHTALPFLTIVSNKWKGAFTGLPARDCIYAALEGSWTELSLPAAQLAPYELPESEPDRPGLEIWIGDHYGILKVTAVCSATYYDIGYIEQLVEAVGELLLGLNSSPR